MPINTLLRTIAYVPALASRPFLAAFFIAIITRLEVEGYLPFGLTAPDWFTSGLSLMILGGLALVEIIATKNSELQMLFTEFGPILKGIVTLIVTLALVNGESAALMGTIADVDSISVLGAAWTGFVSFVSWVVARLRNGLYQFLRLIDGEDDLGVQSLAVWAEDASIILSILFATIFPLIAIVLFVMTLLSLFVIQKIIERQELKKQISCTHCSQKIFAPALTCPHCQQANPTPYQIGTIGQTTPRLTTDREQHALHLISRLRCPSCATHLSKRGIRQTCSTCQTEVFDSQETLDAYFKSLEPTLGKTLLVCLFFGAIPIFGLAPGIIYYRLSLTASLRRYTPSSIGCFAQWGIRLLNIGLIALQPLPILGAFVLPLLCFTNYVVHLKILQRAGEKTFGQPSSYANVRARLSTSK